MPVVRSEADKTGTASKGGVLSDSITVPPIVRLEAPKEKRG